MEYKYEMRGLLAEISVPEEHRSSLIGSVWAKGERQTAAHAKEFVETKIKEGIINQDQASTSYQANRRLHCQEMIIRS